MEGQAAGCAPTRGVTVDAADNAALEGQKQAWLKRIRAMVGLRPRVNYEAAMPGGCEEGAAVEGHCR